VLPLGPRTVAVNYVEAASPAFTGLLVAAAVVLTLLAATIMAASMGAWPGYLATLAENFWLSLGGALGLGALGAGIGALVGMKAAAGPRPPKKPRRRSPRRQEGRAGPGVKLRPRRCPDAVKQPLGDRRPAPPRAGIRKSQFVAKKLDFGRMTRGISLQFTADSDGTPRWDSTWTN